MHYHKTRQTVTSKTTQKQIQRTINNNSENQFAIRNRLIIKKHLCFECWCARINLMSNITHHEIKKKENTGKRIPE